MEGVQEMTADHFAAEAMAADMDRWIIFDAERIDLEEVTEQFERWLKDNQPSQILRYQLVKLFTLLERFNHQGVRFFSNELMLGKKSKKYGVIEPYFFQIKC